MEAEGGVSFSSVDYGNELPTIDEGQEGAPEAPPVLVEPPQSLPLAAPAPAGHQPGMYRRWGGGGGQMVTVRDSGHGFGACRERTEDGLTKHQWGAETFDARLVAALLVEVVIAGIHCLWRIIMKWKRQLLTSYFVQRF